MTPAQKIRPYWLTVVLSTDSKNQLSGNMKGLHFQFIVSLLILTKYIVSLSRHSASTQILIKHSVCLVLIQELIGHACALSLERSDASFVCLKAT